MRLLGPVWIVQVIFLSGLFLSIHMVSCGALDCSWERATNSRGLSLHRASCLLFKRHSVRAIQKRRERAKEAAFAELAAADLPVNTSSSYVSGSGSFYLTQISFNLCELEF